MGSMSGKNLTPPLKTLAVTQGKLYFFQIESNMIPSRTAEAIKLEHFQIDNQKSDGRGQHCSTQQRSFTP